MWITPYRQDTDFTFPITFNDKVTIFYEQTLGWRLEIAERVCDNIQHSGYATLAIAVSYFEMIAKYQNGYRGIGSSKQHFKEGVRIVFPPLNYMTTATLNRLLDILYHGCRCGLYHRGLANAEVGLNGQIDAPIVYDATNEKLLINPRRLVTALEMDLENYVRRLRNPANTQLRQNFEQRFDFDVSH